MNARRVGLIAKKEIFGLSAEKTIVFAILLQVFIAMFSSFLMTGLTAMYDPDALEGYSTALTVSGMPEPTLRSSMSSGDAMISCFSVWTLIRRSLRSASEGLQRRSLSRIRRLTPRSRS